jgi:hypothetical protein
MLFLYGSSSLAHLKIEFIYLSIYLFVVSGKAVFRKSCCSDNGDERTH